MIEVPQHWRAQFDGLSLIASHPDGREVATLRYQERIYPLLSPPELLRSHLDEPPELVLRMQSPFERLITDDGEYAVLVTVDGELSGRAARIEAGWIIAGCACCSLAVTRSCMRSRARWS